MITLKEFDKKIKNCRKCNLYKTRKYAVPGEGNLKAKIMLIGQNPGVEEDKIGKPFVGKAGKYLNKLLKENKITREKLYITNIVKCKTPANRKPNSKEIKTCMPYLINQIKLIKPKLIVLMGEIAWKTPVIKGIKYMKIYHPAAAMRFSKFRRKFEKDFKKLKKINFR